MRKSIHTRQYRTLIRLLVDARKKAGLTQAGLAQKLGRPQSFVAKTENRERRLDVVELLHVARLLRADVHRLIRDMQKP